MNIHTATEVSYKNGYNKAAQDLRESTTWLRIDDRQYQCNECKAINNRPSHFCPDCGRVTDH